MRPTFKLVGGRPWRGKEEGSEDGVFVSRAHERARRNRNINNSDMHTEGEGESGGRERARERKIHRQTGQGGEFCTRGRRALARGRVGSPAAAIAGRELLGVDVVLGVARGRRRHLTRRARMVGSVEVVHSRRSQLQRRRGPVPLVWRELVGRGGQHGGRAHHGTLAHPSHIALRYERS